MLFQVAKPSHALALIAANAGSANASGDLYPDIASTVLSNPGTVKASDNLSFFNGDCGCAVGDPFRMLNATGMLDGSFAGLTLLSLAAGNFLPVQANAQGDVWLKVTQTVTAAMPEPST